MRACVCVCDVRVMLHYLIHSKFIPYIPNFIRLSLTIRVCVRTLCIQSLRLFLALASCTYPPHLARIARNYSNFRMQSFHKHSISRAYVQCSFCLSVSCECALFLLAFRSDVFFFVFKTKLGNS